MKNKSVTIKRIILFCVLAVVPLCIAVPILNHAYDAPIFTSEKGVAAAYVLGVFGMFAPSLAAVLTRLITKEGFSDSYLGLNCKGNLRYYLAAVLVKPAEALIAMLLICAVLLKLPLADAFSDEQIGQKVFSLIFFPATAAEATVADAATAAAVFLMSIFILFSPYKKLILYNCKAFHCKNNRVNCEH